MLPGQGKEQIHLCTPERHSPPPQGKCTPRARHKLLKAPSLSSTQGSCRPFRWVKRTNNQGVKLAPGAAQRAAHTAGCVPACFGSLLQPEAVSAELNLAQMPAIAEKCPKTTACSAKSLGATDVNKKLLSHDRRGWVLKPKALPWCVLAGHREQPGTAPAGQQHEASRDTAAHVLHLSSVEQCMVINMASDSHPTATEPSSQVAPSSMKQNMKPAPLKVPNTLSSVVFFGLFCFFVPP